jgi:hypothetical protein
MTPPPAWRRHLDALFGDIEEGLVELRFVGPLDPATRKKPVHRAFVAPGDHARIYAALLAHRQWDSYVGMALRADDRSGELQNCRQLPGVFADLDAKPGNTPDDIARRVAAFPVPPSIVVRSGSGGLHVVYLLTEPVDAQAPELPAVLRRLAHALHGDLASAEVARVLRVAGTFNHKHTPPKRVELLDCDPARRYHLSDLDELLGDDPAPKARPQVAPSGAPLLTRLAQAGLYLRPLGGRKHAIVCPWKHVHTVDSGDSETAVYEPENPGGGWGFKCQHAHCAERTIGDVYRSLAGSDRTPAAIPRRTLYVRVRR